MAIRDIVDRVFHRGLPTEEIVGQITALIPDPKGDGKSASVRLDSLPNMEFRQRPNSLTSVHRTGEKVKITYSVTGVGVATVDWIEKV